MMKNFYKLSVLFAVLFVAVNVFAQPVEITNGGFEDGIDDGSWGFDKNDGANALFELETTDVKEGEKALKIYSMANGTEEWSTQVLNRTWHCDKGSYYRASCWFKNVTANDVDSAIVSFTIGENVTYVEQGRVDKYKLPKDEWVELAFNWKSNFTAGEPNEASMATHILSICDIIMDDFTIVEIQHKGVDVADDGTQIIVEFVGDLADPVGNEAAFAVTLDGEANAVTGVALNPDAADELLITLTTAIDSTHDVNLIYSPGSLALEDGTEIQGFSELVQEGEKEIGTPLRRIEITQVDVYPNPASSVVYFDNVEAVSTVNFVDISGKVVKKVNGDDIISVNIEDLHSGLYFIVMHGQNCRVFSSKLLID